MEAAQASNTTIVGWVERVHLDDVDQGFVAKLDTGATTSSIDAKIIKVDAPKEKKRGEHGHIVFSVQDDESTARVLKRKILRWVRIKKKDSGFLRRPVVNMAFCIGEKLIRDEVNLADREGFLYPVLVGRNMLKRGNVAVDSSRTFATKPQCAVEKD